MNCRTTTVQADESVSRSEVRSFNQAGQPSAAKTTARQQLLSAQIKAQSSEQNDSAWKRARNDRGSGEQSRPLTIRPDASVTRSDGNLYPEDPDGPFGARPDGVERHEAVVTPAFAMNPKFKDIFASECPASESSPIRDSNPTQKAA